MRGTRPKRILLIEDEAAIRTIVGLALESLGRFTVEACGGAVEALERASTFAPDLILLDVMMPDMAGPETLHALQRIPETAATPVIFLTAKSSAQDCAGLKRLGALGVIFKPFDPMRLPGEIQRVWDRGVRA